MNFLLFWNYKLSINTSLGALFVFKNQNNELYRKPKENSCSQGVVLEFRDQLLHNKDGAFVTLSKLGDMLQVIWRD